MSDNDIKDIDLEDLEQMDERDLHWVIDAAKYILNARRRVEEWGDLDPADFPSGPPLRCDVVEEDAS